MRIGVIGGGVGGLSIAAILRNQHPEASVTLLERSKNLGGRCTSFDTLAGSQSFRHEEGPSLMLLPEVYEEIFKRSGTTASACGLNYVECSDPPYMCYIQEGNGESTRTEKMLLGGSAKNDPTFEEYLDVSELLLDVGLPLAIEESPSKVPVSSILPLVKSLLRHKFNPLGSFMKNLDGFNNMSPAMKAAASFQSLYVGLKPDSAPAVFSLLSALELRKGVFAPLGGFASVRDSLVRACGDGVEFRVGTAVTR